MTVAWRMVRAGSSGIRSGLGRTCTLTQQRVKNSGGERLDGQLLLEVRRLAGRERQATAYFFERRWLAKSNRRKGEGEKLVSTGVPRWRVGGLRPPTAEMRGPGNRSTSIPRASACDLPGPHSIAARSAAANRLSRFGLSHSFSLLTFSCCFETRGCRANLQTARLLGLLAAHLTAESHQHVLAAARHKSKREVEEIVASLRPQPAVPRIGTIVLSRPSFTRKIIGGMCKRHCEMV